MPLRTSSYKKETTGRFNRVLFIKNLTRFWPLWTLYALFWVIAMPVLQSVHLFGEESRSESREELYSFASSQTLKMGVDLGIWVSLAAGCLFAMALFSYLYSARSVGMMHALPIRRQELFAVQYLSGVGVFLATDIAVFLLTAAVQGAAGVLNWKNLLIWFGCNAGMMLFFYSLAVFCAMFTGQILALPVFYGILNGLAAGINYLLQTFAGSFLYGYTMGESVWLPWLTPVWKLSAGIKIHSTWNEKAGCYVNYHAEHLYLAAVYAAVGIVLAILAVLIYKTRRSELAGDTVTVRWVRPVFRWGVALCSAFGLGQALYFLIIQQFSSYQTSKILGTMVSIVLCGLVGYFAAEMLLEKSFHVFYRSWKGAAILTAILLAAGIGTSLDVCGVAKRTPDLNEVKQLSFQVGGQNDCSGETANADIIRAFVQAQKAIIDEKDLMRGREKSYYQHQKDTPYGCANVSLRYKMKNGSTVNRDYSVYYKSSDLSKDEKNTVALLSKLVRDPDVQTVNLLGNTSEEQIVNGEMEYRTTGGGYETVDFDRETAREIYQAVKKDIAAGNFGTNSFDEQNWLKETYANNLILYTQRKNADGETHSNQRYISFSCNSTAVLAVLKEKGVVNAEHPLITCAEEEKMDKQTQ